MVVPWRELVEADAMPTPDVLLAEVCLVRKNPAGGGGMRDATTSRRAPDDRGKQRIACRNAAGDAPCTADF